MRPRTVLLLALAFFAVSARGGGLGLLPWRGDADLGAALDEEIERSLGRLHPQIVEVSAGCDVVCARERGLDGLLERATRSSDLQCVELRLLLLNDETQELAICRSETLALQEAIRAEVPNAFRAPLARWNRDIADIRDRDFDDEPNKPPKPRLGQTLEPARPELVNAGMTTTLVGGVIALVGVGTSLALLPVINDPNADRQAKDVALTVGRAGLFIGLAAGTLTAATGGLVWGLGYRE